MTLAVDQAVEDVPPSAKLVYLILSHAETDLTTAQLSNRTLLNRRTVNNALEKLREAGFAEREQLGDRAGTYCHRITESEPPWVVPNSESTGGPPECDNCGNVVSKDYVRVFSDDPENQTLQHCAKCRSRTERY